MVEYRFFFFFFYILREQIFLQFFALDRTQSTKKIFTFRSRQQETFIRVLLAMICQILDFGFVF